MSRPPLGAPPRILVAGSANLDFITRVPHLPAPGETVLGGDYLCAPGGKGANQAVACARAGGRVAFLGALGRDAFAGTLRDSLAASGVEDRTLSVDAPTGAAFISVSEEGENAITVASGANAALRPEHLPALDGLTHLALQLESPLATVLDYATRAREAGVTVVLNAAPAPTDPLPPELLRNVDLLVVNEGELAALVGATGPDLDLRAALRRARELGPEAVVVTLGGRGSLTLSGAEFTETPAHPVPVVDTTGAGDTFAGALLAFLSEGQELAAALRWAGVAAALACTRVGAQPSMPTRAEIEAALG